MAAAKGPKDTAKKRAFAHAFFGSGNAAEAYRTAYDVEENARDTWIYVEACQLLTDPNVALILSELEEQAAKLSIFTRAAAMIEYEEARQLAKKEGQAAASVSATTSKVKLAGLDRPQRIRVEGQNGGAIQVEDISARDILSSRIAGLAARTGTPSDDGGTDGPTD